MNDNLNNTENTQTNDTNTLLNALDALKNRFVEKGTQTSSFYLNKCSDDALDLIAIGNALCVNVVDFIKSDDGTLVLDLECASIHRIKDALSMSSVDECLKAIKGLIPGLDKKSEEEIRDFFNDGKPKLLNFIDAFYNKYTKRMNGYSTTLKALKEKARVNQKENGQADLFLGYPFGECYYKVDSATKLFRGPLALTSVTIREVGTKFHIQKNAKPFVNPILLIVKQLMTSSKIDQIEYTIGSLKDFSEVKAVLKKANAECYEDNNSEYEIFEDINKTDFIKKRNVLQGIKIVKNAIVGFFSVSSEASYKDFLEILKTDFKDDSTFIKIIGNERGVVRPKSSLDENNIKLMSPLDLYQGITVQESIKDNFAISGPPGTGKTQVITNIIFNAMAEHKQVLVVTEKKDAIEVVENRLKDFSNYIINLEKIPNVDSLKNKINKTIQDIRSKGQLQKDYELGDLKDYYKEYNAYLHSFDKYKNSGYASKDIFEALLEGVDVKYKDLFQIFRDYGMYNVPMKAFFKDVFELGLLTAYEYRYNEFSQYGLEDIFDEISNAAVNEIHYALDEYKYSDEKNFEKFISRKEKSDKEFMKEFKALDVKQGKIIKRISKYADKINAQNLLITNEISDAQVKVLNFIISHSITEQKEIENEYLKYLYVLWNNENRTALAIVDQYQRKLDLAVTDYEKKVESDKKTVLGNFKYYMIEKLSRKDGSNQYVNELLRDLTNNRKSLRECFNRYIEVIDELYPVKLSTPATVCELIPLKEGMYDIIIFDEASQQTIEKSLPIIFRGKKIVAVGDDKQMSPTSYFTTEVEIEEETVDQYKNVEQALLYAKSLLAFVSTQFNDETLNYHYRSKCAELVEFSNKSFYNNELIVADVAKLIDKPVEVIEVNGEYHNTTNKDEANEVVKQVEQILTTKEKKETIGVITFNAKQQELITNLLNKAKVTNKDLLYEMDERPEDEKLFIKNLDTVQGDERDIVLFSLGYGKLKEGDAEEGDAGGDPKYPKAFGPLAQIGGEKRLNVAITRAIRKMIICKSIYSYNLTGTYKNPGVIYFRKYLETLESFVRNSGDVCLEAPTPFLKKIADKLNPKLPQGLELHFQKKIGTFVVDIAVFDKAQNKYVLGIYLEQSSNDTDVQREYFNYRYICGRGWNIYYLFYKNWLKSENMEIDHIINYLKNCMKK